MSEVAIELYNPAKEVSELKARVASLEAQLGMMRGTLDAQAEFIRLGLSSVFHRIAEELGDGIHEAQPTSASNAKWESWKKNLPGRPAEFIDLLLIHGEMTAAQLMAGAKCAKQTVYNTTYTLMKAGLLISGGGKYRLKDL